MFQVIQEACESTSIAHAEQLRRHLNVALAPAAEAARATIAKSFADFRMI